MEKKTTVKSLVVIPTTLLKWYVMGIRKIKKIRIKIKIRWTIKIRSRTISSIYWKEIKAKRREKK
jgi:hypothetical protein